MTYRNDLDALEARHAALEAEVADRTRQRDELAHMIEEARRRDHEARLAHDWAAGGPARRRRQRINIGVAVGASLVLGLGLVRLAQRPSERERQVQVAIAQLESFTDEICACTTRACVDAVSERLTKWSRDLARHDWHDEKPDRALSERVSKIATRLGECMSKGYKLDVPAEAP